MNSLKKPINVFFFGGPANGKTYFLHKYFYKQDNPSTSPTVGTEYFETKVPLNKSQNIGVRLWDTCGQQKLHRYIPTFIRGKDNKSFVIFTDATSRDIKHQVEYYVKLIQASKRDKENVRILILCNKMDLQQMLCCYIINEIRNTYLQRPNFEFELISCKTDFQRAKNKVQDFIKKCYQEHYPQKLRQLHQHHSKVLNFVNELRCQSLDIQWFQDQKKRDAVQYYFKQRLAKKKNMEEAMVLSLVLNTFQKSFLYLEGEIWNLRLRQEQYLIHQETKMKNEKEQIITQITQACKKEHEKEILKLRQKIMEYEYWIVEADRLHYSISQAIANSPFKHKFDQFKRVAEEANSKLQQFLGLREIQQDEGNIGGSLIEFGLNELGEKTKRMLTQRSALQASVQQLQLIVDEYLPVL